MRTRSRFVQAFQWMFGEPDDARMARHVQHVEDLKERKRETEVLDSYSVAYMRGLRQRIVKGVKPGVPLVQTRAQFLYFKDALKVKKRQEEKEAAAAAAKEAATR